MAGVRLVNIAKSYGEVKVVKCMNLDIVDGEFMVLVGPSGCGKSTTLRMIAGLEDVDEGELHIGGRVVNAVQAKDRDIAMVFQNYALYPHMNVFRNMAFGLELRKFPKEEIGKRVNEAAEILDLKHLLDRKPKALSGGQRQRVALGRAIVRQPEVFLFDEPLSNLDAQLRVQMRAELSKLHKRLGCTMVYVTHDQVEAMTMGTRIVVMKAGDVQQVGTPLELYRSPANIFVAGFIGTPAMNFFAVTLGEGPKLENALLAAPAGGAALSRLKPGKELVMGVRPSDIADLSIAKPAGGTVEFSAAPEVVEILGSTQIAHFSSGGDAFRVELDMRSNPEVGKPMRLGFPVETMHVFDKDSGLAVRQ